MSQTLAVVQACRGELSAVGREGHGQDQLGMPLEALDLLPGGRLSEPDRVVEPGRRDGLAIGAPGHGVDRVGMTTQRSQKRGLLLGKRDARHEVDP